jgi:regulator of sigma E protease
MNVLKLVVPGVAVLGIVIFVHELGHFIMAKLRGVRVTVFSMGFGPAMLKTRRGETEYRLAWFPIGGYVQMAGDSPNEDGTMPTGGPEEFLSHPWFGRVLIALAGPAANLVVAFLVMVSVGLVGVRYADYSNELGAVADTSRVYAAGLRAGDRIVEVAGRRAGSWWGIYAAADSVPKDSALALAVERGGERFRVALEPRDRAPVFAGLRPLPNPPVVGMVVTRMPAYKAGLQEGDRILAVNGKPVTVWDELPAALGSQTDRPVVLRIRRGTQTLEVTVTPMSSGDGGGGRIGIEAPRDRDYVVRLGPIQSVEAGFGATGALIGSVYRGMWLTVSRLLYYREYVGGPLFIAQAASEQARRGLDSFLQFLAMINVAIMAFNLLPLPLLDGGHIVLALLQAVRRRAISAQGYVGFQKVGLVVIGVLFLLIMANDLLQPYLHWQRERSSQQQEVRKAPREGTVVPSPP